MNAIDLKNRHGVVTGGAQGIGFSAARRLLLSGASISIWDMDSKLAEDAEQELSKLGPVDVCTVNVTDADHVADVTETTISRAGKIDILVANAGIAGPNQTTWDYPLDAWKQVINVNLFGVYHCCRAVVPHMIARNYGRIV